LGALREDFEKKKAEQLTALEARKAEIKAEAEIPIWRIHHIDQSPIGTEHRIVRIGRTDSVALLTRLGKGDIYNAKGKEVIIGNPKTNWLARAEVLEVTGQKPYNARLKILGPLEAKLACNYEELVKTGKYRTYTRKGVQDDFAMLEAEMKKIASIKLAEVEKQEQKNLETNQQKEKIMAKEMESLRLRLEKAEEQIKMKDEELASQKLTPEQLKKMIEEAIKGAEKLMTQNRRLVDRCKANKKDTKIKNHCFISHCQQDAQDVCANIQKELRDRNINAWLDMEEAKIDAPAMIEGVATAATFLIYATKQYLTRRFCIFELDVAVALGKPIMLLWEPDTRHGGFRSFDEFIELVPVDYEDQLLRHEATSWERRGKKKAAVLDMIVPRLSITMPLMSWEAAEVADYVSDLGKKYEQYKELIIDNGVDGPSLMDIETKEEFLETFKDLGMKAFHAGVFYRKITALKEASL